MMIVISLSITAYSRYKIDIYLRIIYILLIAYYYFPWINRAFQFFQTFTFFADELFHKIIQWEYIQLDITMNLVKIVDLQ